MNRLRRLKALVDSPLNALITVASLGFLALIGPALLRWAVLDATWSGGQDACRAASGACWT